MADATELNNPPTSATAKSAALNPGKLESLRTQLLNPLPRIGAGSIVLILIMLVVFGSSAIAVQPDMIQITRGKPPIVAVWDFVRKMFPATYEYSTITIAGTAVSYPLPIRFVLQTIQMALIGTLLGVIISLPFGLLAARNTSPHPTIYQITRLILNAIRAVPELIWALIFVSAVGLGPFSGVLALAFAGIGSTGKLYAEAIEAIDPQQVLAVRATGAKRLQIFRYGVIPQAIPVIISYSLLGFESNVRTATILGYVGAGGIGLLIYQYISQFQFDRLLGVVIMIVVTVTVIDRLSDFLRRKFI